MDNRVGITLVNGLGDRFLDLIGFCILCKRMNYVPQISFNMTTQFAWGKTCYDMRMFDFTHTNIVFSDEPCPYQLKSPNPSSSLCPYKVYEYLKPFFPELTFEEISRDFVTSSKELIRPSEIILSSLPANLDQAYGIHLRRTDKVGYYADVRHENLYHEFDLITHKILEDVANIIREEENPKFVIVSEDENWKNEFIRHVMGISGDKPIEIIQIDYSKGQDYYNYASVLDMVCLSKCKDILQGVKYSTFSMLAALLGNRKIRNYSRYTDTYDVCLVHSWASVLEINNEQNFDIEMHRRVTDRVNNIETNIRERFEG